jgi:hypothetical protein
MHKNITRQLEAAVTAWALLLVAVTLADPAFGQLADTSGGLGNRAVGRLSDLSLNGPGYLYYGINGADRGLGYIGSYMTLGGFIPLAEDDLGGVWNADLRSHLSVHGGFFSNVGAVRKQLLGGGSLLGFGIFWDYDGDLNQYPTFGESAAIFGQFGHVYNQVGISGELLTDWGNLRSNGYIPVGQTGFQFLNDHTPFIQNYIIAQNGLDAALGGADLELGAYIPALADWAGMINVGGYAFGNARYTQNYGPGAGDALVPWFGGVYTRLDLTFANNWDFSLQYNNDSFFDSTGFARLTYRMGGSRRRNVPDQMEQPMFRNEHIVRAHETPLVALNPDRGNQPWQVVHVDNSALPNGDGTAERPFRTLALAEGSPIVANQEWAITYVWAGLSSASGNVAINPYTDQFAFQRPNQFLIGSGGPLTIQSQPVNGSSLLTIPALTTTTPVLSNASTQGNIVIANANGGATIANLRTLGSTIGIAASGNLNGTAQPVGTTANMYGSPLSRAGGSAVRNVVITGDGTSAIQRGVRIAAVGDGTGSGFLAGTAPTGSLEFSDTSILNATAQAFQVGLEQTNPTTTPPTVITGSGGNADIDYYGRIVTNTAENGNFSNVLVAVLGTTGGSINLAASSAPSTNSSPSEILDIGGQGILIAGNNTLGTQGATTINIGSTTLIDTTPTAIVILNDFANTSITAVATAATPYGITKTTGNATIGILGGGPLFTFNGTINNAASATPNGPIIGIGGPNPTDQVNQAVINISGPGLEPLLSTAGNVNIQQTLNSTVNISGLNLQGLNPTGISVDALSNGSAFTFTNTTITNATTSGINIAANNSTYTFIDTNISLDGLAAGVVINTTNDSTFSNLNVATNNNAAFIAGLAGITGDLLIDGTSTLISESTITSTLLARSVNADITLASLASGVDNATGIAADFTGTVTGDFTVSDSFIVGGAAGSAANVDDNGGAVTVTLP